ncbi:uncharacterized protein [Medicago truncatula]|uniref:uncharacterized protein isoform X1 n=1 Tax=Medicago truncatula TaxID=3880 RepID=UPI001967FBEE|nr:uncharacterized protein LOC11407623 isoform X1 [Medicago truncatula]
MYTNFNITFSTTPDLQQHNHLGEYESVPQLNSSGGGGGGGNYNSCSSGCASYLGSPDRLMQRSISSHSLQKNDVPHHHPFSTLFAELLDQENGPVRRVYSTGDLDQRVGGMQQYYHQSDSPLSTESNMIIEEMSRPASPYSPEEKKYVCRKTLADSRPRIRGRFAKNDEIVRNPPNQWSHISNGEELEDEEEENWDSLFDSLVPTSNLAPEEHHSSSYSVLY